MKTNKYDKPLFHLISCTRRLCDSAVWLFISAALANIFYYEMVHQVVMELVHKD